MGLFSRKTSSKSPNDIPTQSNNSSSSTQHHSSVPRSSGRASMKPNNSAETSSHVALPKPPDASRDPAGYLRSIHAVRERSALVFEKARANQLRHFEVDMSKFPETARFVTAIIKVCLGLSFV